MSSSPDVAPADIAQPILREEGGNNAQAEPASSVHLAQAEMPVDGPASATERDASSESAAPHDGVVSSALPDSGQSDTIELRDVLLSLEASFPLVQAALLEVPLADGKQIAAWGEFDTKLKAASQNGPSGYYQTYRNDMGFVQPLYTGGEVFGGYRIGRGDFQPWYGERQTNNAGEVKAGARIPLVRNRSIDERRADLWRAEYDRDLAQPEVRLQLLSFAMEGSVAYWSWVAAGRKYQIGAAALMVARERNRQLERRVQEGDVDPPVLQDSLRTIAQRESKLIDLGRKVQQSAVKLSLFYRTLDGTPVVPDRSQLPTFPTPSPVDAGRLSADVQLAIDARPEMEIYDILRQKIEVDRAEGANDMRPSLDAQLSGSQDLGGAASSKRDKSQFELEAGLFFDVPLQRRKGYGKIQAADAKLAQIAAKRVYTEDKIRAEVQAIYAALVAAYERVGKARESLRLATYMAEVERRKFELGESDLLAVALREQYAIEAADDEAEALLEYFVARATYAAVLAIDPAAQAAEADFSSNEVPPMPMPE